MQYVIKSTQTGGYQIRRIFIRDTVQVEPVFLLSELDLIVDLAVVCGVVAERLDPHGISETDMRFEPVIDGPMAFLNYEGYHDWFPDTFHADLDFQFNGAVARELSYALTELMRMAIEANIIAYAAVAA